MFVQPIIAACIKNQRFQFQTYMESLIAVAKRSISPSVKEQSDLPQVSEACRTVYQREQSLRSRKVGFY